MLHRNMMRRASFRHWLLAACAMMLVGLASPSVGQEADESQYRSSLNSALDALIAKCSKLPQRRVIFSANLIFAHGLGIRNTSTTVLLQYIDGLKAAGAQRIEFNPGVTGIDDPEIAQKYDAVVKHIRELGLAVQINLEYAVIGDKKADPKVKRFRDFAAPAVKACEKFAARYHPEYLVPVHEPVTMNSRMKIQAPPRAWAAYVHAAVEAIKRVSPNTSVGAGGLHFELPYYRAFADMPDLDFLTVDIYDHGHFDVYDQMAQIAHAAHKPVFIEETWRTAFTGPLPRNALSVGVQPLAIKGSGNAAFEDLDEKWIRAMALFASTHQIEAVTPFWSQSLFLYVSSGPDRGTEAAYNQKVIRALAQGQRTKLFEVYQSLQHEYGNLH